MHKREGTNMANGRDLYQEVTDKIVSMLEEGAGVNRPLWINSLATAGLPMNAISRKPYQGVNVMLTLASMVAGGYSSPLFLSYKQAQAAGGNVRKGEKGTMVVYFTFLEKEQDGEQVRIPLLRQSTVFNVEQCDSLPEDLLKVNRASILGSNPAEWQEKYDSFFACLQADIRHGGNRAFFSPREDYIMMPEKEAFVDGPAYYSTLAHEVTHWTGAPTRLHREFGKRFGDQAYAFEELVAELGSAFLCAHLGLSPEDPRPDHVGYLAGWLKVLKHDKRAIFTAASSAQKACSFILQKAGVSQQGEGSAEEE
jgi:antirestriction protein ArdC